MLSGGVPTLWWYPSLPDKGYSPHPGGANTGANCRRGSETGGSCADKFSRERKFLGYIFFSAGIVIICVVSMGIMVEEGMVYYD
nr:MAG TPA: hypothetical protein [Crassvirales sp.]